MSDVALVLGLLTAVVVIVSLATRVNIAYPILLVLAGVVLALIPGLPAVKLDPELILVLFLPPLVYSTSLGTSRFELKANRAPILALAVGLVLITMIGVAAVAHVLIPNMTWPVALVLGAVVAPPDPVAAAEVAGKVGLPSRLVSILEGEGLINDGTALTAYQLSLTAVGGTVTLASIGLAAAESLIFGIGIGLVAGLLATRVLRLVEDPVLENTVLLMLPFAAYLPAAGLGGSGVLAVLTAGLWYAHDGRPIMSAAGRLQQRTIWQLVGFILTGLSFLLVGLELRQIVDHLRDNATGIPGGDVRTVATFAAICATVVVLRFAGVFGYAALPGARGRRLPGSRRGADSSQHSPSGHTASQQPSWRSLTVISWAGMRGAVSLAAALAIPDDVPYRGLVIALTFAVILVTLVGQGLTLPWLVRRLHVVSPEGETEFEMLRARHRLTVAGLRRLDEVGVDDSDGEDGPQAEAMARAAALYQRQLDTIEARLADFEGADDDAGATVPEPELAQAARDATAVGDTAAGGGGRVGPPSPAESAAAGVPDALHESSGNGSTAGPDREAGVRAAFRTYVDDVRAAQRAELEHLERRGTVGRVAAERLRSRLDVVELGLPAVPHV